ncbi:GNAT family N-acetyltransferase [Haloarchaeobius iranensis]|uniref:Protein N-acetyltransferase, RimJ/RimL family n=1 Tax=Haloarchaeobius iranensis TaxID=996166 RepID=A0A1G9TKY1_9EURY|nr:GNAT family protein [Haloarchaeobius iranensis]SDM48479.1 Protein N-acetyltransferase, RimJ/RimL family [Haloarchaeobius iranensis]
MGPQRLRVPRPLRWPPEPFDEHDTEGFLDFLRRDDTHALTVCLDGEYVGMVTLKKVRRPADVADACESLFDYGFDPLGLNKIGARAFASNEPSRSLLESLGVTLEGTPREERFANGESHDVLRYGLLAREWRVDG